MRDNVDWLLFLWAHIFFSLLKIMKPHTTSLETQLVHTTDKPNSISYGILKDNWGN